MRCIQLYMSKNIEPRLIAQCMTGKLRMFDVRLVTQIPNQSWSRRLEKSTHCDLSWRKKHGGTEGVKANLFHNPTRSQNGLWTKRGVRGHSDSCSVCGRAIDRSPEHS